MSPMKCSNQQYALDLMAWKARDKELDRTVALKIPKRGGITADEQEFAESLRSLQVIHEESAGQAAASFRLPISWARTHLDHYPNIGDRVLAVGAMRAATIME